MHLTTSDIHNPRTHVCPGRGCKRSFVSRADLTLHWESGTCPSGVTRKGLNQAVVSSDRHNLITNPARLLTNGSAGNYEPTVMWATEQSWNGYLYECVLCHKEFRMLSALNAHLKSPAHDKSIYRCPGAINGCNTEFRTLSALLQHIERGSCGVT